MIQKKKNSLVDQSIICPCATEATLLSRYEWGFSNKMLDLTRHIDSVRKA